MKWCKPYMAVMTIWWLFTQFICFMTGGQFVWLGQQHSILKKDFFIWQLQNYWSSKTLIWYKSCLGKGNSKELKLWWSASWFGNHGKRKLPLTYNGKMVKLHFYAPPQKVASVFCYTIWNFECPSICLGNIQGYNVWAILDIIMRYFEVYSI